MLLSAGPVVILALLIVVLSFLSPYFLTGRNLSNILAQTAVISVVAMGQHLVILTRGIDLSVGSNVALASVVGALSFHAGAPAFVVIAVMVGSGAAVGAINGLFYVFGRLPHPFIITLATLSIAKGLALQLADGGPSRECRLPSMRLAARRSGVCFPNIIVASPPWDKPIDMVNIIGNAKFVYPLSQSYQRIIGSACNEEQFQLLPCSSSSIGEQPVIGIGVRS